MSLQLYSWGANSYGQLGQGHQEDQLLPKIVPLPAAEGHHGNTGGTLQADKIKSISGGGGHSLIVDENGDLYVCGSNSKGQLGLDHTTDVSVFTKMVLPENVQVSKAVGGWDFTVILSELGELFVMGSNEFGQLSQPWGQHQILAPVKVALPPSYGKIVDVAAGLRHTVVLTEKGAVYSWGVKKRQKHEEDMNLSIDLTVKTPVLEADRSSSKVLRVEASSFSTFALTETGQLWIFGSNKHGICTQDFSKIKEVTPFLIPMDTFDSAIDDVTCGWTHCTVRTEKGGIYSWGRGNYGQLGRACDTYDPTPQLVTGLADVSALRSGSEHTMAITGNACLFTWGWNEHGICATGDEINIVTPVKVEAFTNVLVTKIGCGSGHCFALCKEKT